MSSERSELIATISACADALHGLAIDGLDGREAAEQLLALDALAGRFTALSARLVPAVEADGWWAVSGARSIASWLSTASRMAHGRAKRLVAMGRTFAADLETTGEVTAGGDLPIDHAEALVRHAPTSPLRRETLARPASECGEDFLLSHAPLFGADTFTRLVKRWAAAADPDSDDRGYRKASDREHLTLSDTTGGAFLRGFLTTEHGAMLRNALEAVMVPPAKDDERTTPQRRAQALADLARLTLDHGLVGTGSDVRPHLSCVVDFETLQRAVRRAYDADTGDVDTSDADTGDVDTSDADTGDADTSSQCDGTEYAGAHDGDAVGNRPTPGPAVRPLWLPPVADIERFAVAEVLGAGPIPGSVLARLACDSEVTRVVFGPSSQVIDASRAERTFSGPRRRAIVARDQTCRYPGCTAPPALGELHHVDHWAAGGRTDINAGILLCWYHHDLVHRRGISIRPVTRRRVDVHDEARHRPASRGVRAWPFTILATTCDVARRRVDAWLSSSRPRTGRFRAWRRRRTRRSSPTRSTRPSSSVCRPSWSRFRSGSRPQVRASS